MDTIRIRGAREHNLRGVDLDIPRSRLVVFCGVSGSGKSSLAFDTIFAEGQRRYIESLSAYARQFLGQLRKPRYDSIQGLTPTIAVSQRGGSPSPRSTVGTLTEVHDHLRVLFARAGEQRCHRCGAPVQRHSSAEITAALLALPVGTRLTLLAPLGHGRALLDEVRAAGFARVRVAGTIHRLDDLPPLDWRQPLPVDVVVDRLRVRPDIAERLNDSVETTLKVGRGTLIAHTDADRVFSDHLRCHPCGLDFPALEPASFSFNSPKGMCPSCHGLGTRAEIDADRLVPDPSLSIRQGAVQGWKMLTREDAFTTRMLKSLLDDLGATLDTPWGQLTEGARQAILHGAADRTLDVPLAESRGEGTWRTSWEGVIPVMLRRMSQTRSKSQQEHYRSFLSTAECPACHGGRLRVESAAVQVGPLDIVSLSRMTVRHAREALEGLQLHGARATIAEGLLRELGHRLRFLEDVGVGYLSLDRGAATLSGGEAQRIRLASQLGGELTGVTYVLDEPSIGLHARDGRRLVQTLERLRDAGNTVLVVEHDRATIQAADQVVDIGPGAGEHGGQVLYSGPPAGLIACAASLTGAYLSGARSVPRPPPRPEPTRWLQVRGAAAHNLQALDVDIPLGRMVAVTGVSGAGKSSLVQQILSPALHNALHGARRPVGPHQGIEGIEQLGKIIDVNQAPIGRSPRSNPATYTGAFKLIREVFAQTREAKVRGYTASRFSFNSKGGRCEACRGEGWRRVELHFLADVFVPCEICDGRRFNEATLQVRHKGLDMADVLDLTVERALAHFTHHRRIRVILQTLVDVGLGYLRLGQPSNTLSGGEAQRLKLSRELARASDGDTIYILDEPTTGLHFEDTHKLVGILHALVDAGNTVLVVEHDLDLIRCCDHVIDLGPEGGDEGGRVVVAGSPEEIARDPSSHTGRALAEASPP